MSTRHRTLVTALRTQRALPGPTRGRRRALALAGALALVLTSIGCGTEGSADSAPAPSEPTSSVETTTSVAVAPTTAPVASPDEVAAQVPGADTLLGFIATPAEAPVVFAEPRADAERIDIAATSPLGAPAVFAVVGDPSASAGLPGEWIQVALPTRPNEGTGWVDAGSVAISQTSMRISIDLESRTLSVTDDGQAVLETAIAVGTDANPTPVGASFVTELIETPNPSGAYGPYALGLALHSDTLTEFGGGPGQVGIHGTNQPDRIGDAASHGCVRLANEDIATLVDLGVPLGTPVLVS